MKAYLVTTGALFGLLAIAHVVRMLSERPDLASSPWYILITVAMAVLSAWAWRLLRLMSRSRT